MLETCILVSVWVSVRARAREEMLRHIGNSVYHIHKESCGAGVQKQYLVWFCHGKGKIGKLNTMNGLPGEV